MDEYIGFNIDNFSFQYGLKDHFGDGSGEIMGKKIYERTQGDGYGSGDGIINTHYSTKLDGDGGLNYYSYKFEKLIKVYK